MAGGYLGVSTFFTLSGFLITSLLIAEHATTGRIRLANFWERRFRRIMPASFVAMLMAVVFGALFADAYQREHLRGDGLMTLAYSVNWWFIFTRRDYADMFGSPSPVQHFWSLAIEEQFYLFFPLLTWYVLGRTKGSHRCLAIVLATLAALSVARLYFLIPTDVPAARLYYGTDTRAAELLGGCLLAILLANLPGTVSRRRQFLTTSLGVTGLAISVWFWGTMHQGSPGLYAGGLTTFTAGSMGLVAAAVLPSGPIRALLSWYPLRELGRVSYGLYLYHFPVFLVLTPDRAGLAEPWLFTVRLVISLVLAELSFRLVESPIRMGKAVVGRRRYAAPLVAFAVTIAALSWPARDNQAPPARVEQTSGAGTTATPPRRWWSEESRRVLVVGDSVADNLGHALGRWASARSEMAVVVEARRGCGLARGGLETDRDRRIRAEECASWLATLPGTIARLQPEVVVVYTASWDLVDTRLPQWTSARTIGDAAFDEWLRSEYRLWIEVLTARGARVVWVSALCAKSPGVDRRGAFDPVRVLRLNRLLVDLLSGEPERAEYLDLFTQVCPGGQFVDVLHGIDNIRPDGMHFSPAAADWVAAWVAPRLLDQAPRR